MLNLEDEIKVAKIDSQILWGIWSNDKERADTMKEDVEKINKIIKPHKLKMYQAESLSQTATYTNAHIDNAAHENISHAIRDADNNAINNSFVTAIRNGKINTHPMLRFIATGKFITPKRNAHIDIYTDGSAKDDRVSYAVYSPNFDKHTQEK